ncbi:hypothetical protein MCEMSE15_00499 [Fimbriimonadaceae bacterium]
MNRIIEFIQTWRDDDRVRIAFIVVGVIFWVTAWIIYEIPKAVTAGTTLSIDRLTMTTPNPGSVQRKYEYFDGTGLEKRSSRRNFGHKIVLQGPKENIIWLQPALETNIPSKENNYSQIPGSERLRKGLTARFGSPNLVSPISTLYNTISVENGEVWHFTDGSTLIWFYPAESKLKDFVVAKTPSSCPNPEDETCQILFEGISSVSVLPKSDY